MKQFDQTVKPQKQNKQLFENLRQTQVLKKSWKTIVPDSLADTVKIDYIKENTCVLVVNNPCCKNEVTFYEKMLLVKINNILKRKPKINAIRVAVI